MTSYLLPDQRKSVKKQLYTNNTVPNNRKHSPEHQCDWDAGTALHGCPRHDVVHATHTLARCTGSVQA